MLLGKGFGFTARKSTALCADIHHFILSRTKNASFSVFSSTEIQSDDKARGSYFCVSKWPQDPERQPVYKGGKEVSGISPHGYICVLLHLS